MHTELIKFPAFQEFKRLFGSWWNMDILFLIKEEDNLIFNELDALRNPLVKSFLSHSVFNSHFTTSIRDYLEKNKESGSIYWKQTGLKLIIIPLFKEKGRSYMLVATGFLNKKKDELEQACSYVGITGKERESRIKSLKTVTAKEELYIQKMLGSMSGSFLKLLREKEIKESFFGEDSSQVENFVGESASMKYVFESLKKIKNYDPPLLIEGENGTGKRHLGKIIHKDSIRSKKSFFIQNFSEFKGLLSEREVFGWMPGTFSKSDPGKKSLLEKLDGGTLFLNEIGSTSREFQERLLKFIKEGEFFSDGGKEIKKANVRILASSSKSVPVLIKAGEFLSDLYVALNVLNIKLPPLRERKEDIPLLANHFAKLFNPSDTPKFSKEVLRLFYDYSWPRNASELRHEVKRLTDFKEKKQQIWEPYDLSSHIKLFGVKLSEEKYLKQNNLKETMRAIEKELLLQSLRRHRWNKSQVSKALGISRTSLLLKQKEYSLDKSKNKKENPFEERRKDWKKFKKAN